MKPNELMIGDWVCVTKNFTQKYHRIRALSNDEKDVLKGTYTNNYGAECNSIFSHNEIEPILLTAKILEKNGYHTTPVYDIDDDSIVYQHIDLCGEFTWYDGKIYYSISDEEMVVLFDCKYVHEFQHLLRLWGIEKEFVL